MFVFYFILFILCSLFLYLLFAPFYIEVNTNTGVLQLRFHRAASISLRMEEKFFLQLQILGWIKRFDLETKQIRKEPVKSPGTIHGSRVSFNQLRAIVNSFRVIACKVSLDTGNMQWNAILFPLFYFLKWRSGRDLEINFTGSNEIVLKIRNNIAGVGWALISAR